MPDKKRMVYSKLDIDILNEMLNNLDDEDKMQVLRLEKRWGKKLSELKDIAENKNETPPMSNMA